MARGHPPKDTAGCSHSGHARGCSSLSAHNGFEPIAAILCVFFALFMQVGTNLANDYLDGVKGTDYPIGLGRGEPQPPERFPPGSCFARQLPF